MGQQERRQYPGEVTGRTPSFAAADRLAPVRGGGGRKVEGFRPGRTEPRAPGSETLSIPYDSTELRTIA